MFTNGKLPTNPLHGRRILVTRAAEQAAGITGQLQQRGAVVLECPTIQLMPPVQWDEIDAAINDLSTVDWLILTSVNGVRFFFDRVQELGFKLTVLQGCKVCAVGPKTAEALAARGIATDLVPEQFTGEGLVAAFQGLDLQGRRVLFPKADGARDLIPQQLRKMGALLIDPVVYRTVIPDRLPDQAQTELQQQLDAVIFSSPSTAKNLATLVGGVAQLSEMLTGVCVASIGPVTSKACRELGLAVTVEPGQATLDTLLDELEQYFSDAKKPHR
jgi:uroporphyrinogen-III synthase